MSCFLGDIKSSSVVLALIIIGYTKSHDKKEKENHSRNYWTSDYRNQ